MPPALQKTSDAMGLRRISYSRKEKTAVAPNNVLQIYRYTPRLDLRLSWEQVAFLLVVWAHVTKILPGFVEETPECVTVPVTFHFFVDSVQLPLALDTIAARNTQGQWQVSSDLIAAAGDKIRLAHDGAGPDPVEMAYLLWALHDMNDCFSVANGWTTSSSAKDMWKKDPAGLVYRVRKVVKELEKDIETWEEAMSTMGSPEDGGVGEKGLRRHLV